MILQPCFIAASGGSAVWHPRPFVCAIPRHKFINSRYILRLLCFQPVHNRLSSHTCCQFAFVIADGPYSFGPSFPTFPPEVMVLTVPFVEHHRPRLAFPFFS